MLKDFSVLGDAYLADQEVLTRKNGFFKAAAVGAVAFVLNDIENLVALVALGKAGDDVYNELCVLESCVLNDDGVDLLDVLGDDQRQLADVQNDLRDLFNVVLLGKIGYGFDH